MVVRWELGFFVSTPRNIVTENYISHGLTVLSSFKMYAVRVRASTFTSGVAPIQT